MSKTDDNKQTRRTALAQLGAAGALLTACKKGFSPAADDDYSRARDKPYVPGAHSYSTHEERWAATSCDQCPAGCGIRVRVVEGRAVRIEGNPDNPLNGGGIGPRGLAGLQVLYDPDRITGPQVRRGGALVSATWDEALEATASALAAAGPRVLIMSGRERGMQNDLWRRFARALGGAQFIDGRHGHSGPIAAAMRETVGVDEIPSYDWGGARTVLSLEASLLEDSCQAVYFSRLAAERRGRERPRIIHASSGFDLTAKSADQWHRVEPGTSGALALGIAGVLFADGTYDEAALAQVGNRAAFEALARAFTLERTASITGLGAEAIATTARRLWREQPSFAFIDERSVSFGNGKESARAVLALNVMLGAFEAPSGGLRIPATAPLRDWPAIDGELATLAQPSEVLASLEGASPPRLALLSHVNPLFSRAQPGRWREALARVETIVSFSPFLDETTAEMAHVVLPDHTYLERREDASPAPALARVVVGVRQPVVAPLHETRATGDVVIELARRVGGPLAAAIPWPRFAQAIEARLLGLHDADRGSVRGASEHEFLSKLYAAGFWAELAAPPPGAVAPQLPERWSEPPWRGDPSAFPLRLIVYRPLGTTSGGGGANQPWLSQLKGRLGDRPWRLPARLHPDTLPALRDGDAIAITSERGSITIPVLLDRGLAPGLVAVPLGGGHTEFGRFARGRGVNPMTILASDLLCETRVAIARAS